MIDANGGGIGLSQRLTNIETDIKGIRDDIQPIVMMISLMPPQQWIASIKETADMKRDIDTLKADKVGRTEGRQWRIGLMVTAATGSVAMVLGLVNLLVIHRP